MPKRTAVKMLKSAKTGMYLIFRVNKMDQQQLNSVVFVFHVTDAILV